MTPLRRLLAPVLAALAASAGLVVLTALPAEACSCVGGGPAKYTRWADVVLVGTVTDIERTDPGGGAVQSSLDPVRYTVDEERLLKGSLGDADEVVVTSARDSASCGLDGIKVGTAYVVFASRTRDDGLTSGSCSGTARETPALVAAVEAALDPAPAPDPRDDPPTGPVPREVPSGVPGRTGGDAPAWAWFGSGVLLVLLGGGAALRWRVIG